jgi:hypothetical protein
VWPSLVKVGEYVHRMARIVVGRGKAGLRRDHNVLVFQWLVLKARL